MLTLVTISALVALCSGQSRTIDVHQFGQTIELHCTTKSVTPSNDTFVHRWLIPDYKAEDGKSVMMANETYNMSSTWMELGGWKLKIGGIRHTEAGEYTCVWQEDGEEQMDDINLKYVPPSQWSVYKDNVTVGLSVTAIFIGIIILIFLVYYFRWKDPVEERGIRFTSNGVEQRPDNVYENQAYHGTDPAVQVVHRNSGGISESKM